jgi:hypothetical protein
MTVLSPCVLESSLVACYESRCFVIPANAGIQTGPRIGVRSDEMQFPEASVHRAGKTKQAEHRLDIFSRT